MKDDSVEEIKKYFKNWTRLNQLLFITAGFGIFTDLQGIAVVSIGSIAALGYLLGVSLRNLNRMYPS